VLFCLRHSGAGHRPPKGYRAEPAHSHVSLELASCNRGLPKARELRWHKDCTWDERANGQIRGYVAITLPVVQVESENSASRIESSGV
jgi:hypothetical protein